MLFQSISSNARNTTPLAKNKSCYLYTVKFKDFDSEPTLKNMWNSEYRMLKHPSSQKQYQGHDLSVLSGSYRPEFAPCMGLFCISDSFQVSERKLQKKSAEQITCYCRVTEVGCGGVWPNDWHLVNSTGIFSLLDFKVTSQLPNVNITEDVLLNDGSIGGKYSKTTLKSLFVTIRLCWSFRSYCSALQTVESLWYLHDKVLCSLTSL